MVVTLPKLRRMMWTGTLMLKANAQLLSMFTLQNIAAMITHFEVGTSGVRRVLGLENEICVGYAAKVAKRNWMNVMRRPDHGQCLEYKASLVTWMSIADRYLVHSWTMLVTTVSHEMKAWLT